MLPIAPSTYFRHKAARGIRRRRSARAQRDDVLRAIIRRVWDENHRVYGPRKVWQQMGREGLHVARCRVRRLMREMGLAGAVRGRAWTITTQSQPDADRPSRSRRSALHRDAPEPALGRGLHVRRDLARASCTSRSSIDVFARRIVGWRVSTSLRTDFALDALEQAIYERVATTSAT